MVAGVGVLAAPVAGLAVGGYALIARRNRKRLVQAKEYLLKQVVAKHDAVLKALKKRVDLSEERVQYLEALNISLRRAISDLEEDLAA